MNPFGPRWSGMRWLFMAALIGSAVGLWAQAPADGRALIPEKYRTFTSAQLNTQGLAAHKEKDFETSALFFWYATLAAPKEARGHFNLACAFIRQGSPLSKDAAVPELRLALELDRKWTVPNLDDGDLLTLRGEPSYSDLMIWLTGSAGVPNGTWTTNGVPRESLPAWLSPDDLAGPAYSVSFKPKGAFSVTTAAGYTIKGSGELRGTSFSWRGLMSVQSPDGDAVVTPVGGIMQAHLLSPRILELHRVLGSEGLPEGVLLLSGS
jgi:hypothetical protein